MGQHVQCPYCGKRFYIHGYEQQAKCYDCNTLFNPQRSPAPRERA